MKRIHAVFLVALLFLSLSTSLHAQVLPSDMWHEGRIVLVNYDTLKGLVKYNLERDLVQFNQDDKIKTFSARKVIFFEIFDASVEDYRHFYALPYRVKRNYKVPLFFEVLYEGKLSLLSREMIEEENVSQNGYYSGTTASASRKRLIFHYYFIGSDGEILDYNKKRKELFDIMGRYEGQVRRYMKDQRLKSDRKVDLMLITEYYNDLLQKK